MMLHYIDGFIEYYITLIHKYSVSYDVNAKCDIKIKKEFELKL